MLMMALLPPGGLLGGYAADPGGVNGSWEEACTCVSNPIRVRVALAAGEFAHRLPQRLFLACPRPASMACALPCCLQRALGQCYHTGLDQCDNTKSAKTAQKRPLPGP